MRTCLCSCCNNLPQSGGSVAGMGEHQNLQRGTIIEGTRLMRCHNNLARSAADLSRGERLDKCSSLPSSDMKIGSHSGLLSKLINILSAKTGPVCEQEEPPHTCASRKPEASARAWPSGASAAAWGTPRPAEDGWVLQRTCWGLSSLPGWRT